MTDNQPATISNDAGGAGSKAPAVSARDKARAVYEQQKLQLQVKPVIRPAPASIPPKPTAAAAGDTTASTSLLDNLPQAIATAPRYGMNARALVLKAAALLAEEEGPVPGSAPQPSRSAMPAARPSRAVAGPAAGAPSLASSRPGPAVPISTLVGADLTALIPVAERPLVAYVPRSNIPRFVRQNGCDSLLGQFLVMLVELCGLNEQVAAAKVITSDPEVMRVAGRAAEAQEQGVYRQVYTQAAYQALVSRTTASADYLKPMEAEVQGIKARHGIATDNAAGGDGDSSAGTGAGAGARLPDTGGAGGGGGGGLHQGDEDSMEDLFGSESESVSDGGGSLSTTRSAKRARLDTEQRLQQPQHASHQDADLRGLFGSDDEEEEGEEDEGAVEAVQGRAAQGSAHQAMRHTAPGAIEDMGSGPQGSETHADDPAAASADGTLENITTPTTAVPVAPPAPAGPAGPAAEGDTDLIVDPAFPSPTHGPASPAGATQAAAAGSPAQVNSLHQRPEPVHSHHSPPYHAHNTNLDHPHLAHRSNHNKPMAVVRLPSSHSAGPATGSPQEADPGPATDSRHHDSAVHASLQQPASSHNLQVSNQVAEFIKAMLDPLYRAQLLHKEQYKHIVRKAASKVMQRHGNAGSADFLLVEHEDIRKFVMKLVEHERSKGL